jgi:hypothetical protein
LNVTPETRAIVVSTPVFRPRSVLYDQVKMLLSEGHRVFAPATLNSEVLPLSVPVQFNPFFSNWFTAEIDILPGPEVRDVVIACEDFADGASLSVRGIEDDVVAELTVPVSNVSIWKWYDYIAKNKYLITDNPWLACLFGAVRGTSAVCFIGGIRSFAATVGMTSNIGNGWVALIRDTANRRRAQCQSS